jgi:hypothetical protein
MLAFVLVKVFMKRNFAHIFVASLKGMFKIMKNGAF